MAPALGLADAGETGAGQSGVMAASRARLDEIAFAETTGCFAKDLRGPSRSRDGARDRGQTARSVAGPSRVRPQVLHTGALSNFGERRVPAVPKLPKRPGAFSDRTYEPGPVW